MWLAIPFNVVISWIFYTMERIADVTENPFVGLANDVPITTISHAIEIEMLELIGADVKDIPKPVQPVFDISMEADIKLLLYAETTKAEAIS